MGIPLGAERLTNRRLLGRTLAMARRLGGGRAASRATAAIPLLDRVAQVFSDQLILSESARRPSALRLKHAVMQAAVPLHEARILMKLKGNQSRADAAIELGCQLLLPSELALDLARIGQRVPRPARPQRPELALHPIDGSALLLAVSFLLDDFSPDLVVGIPTGGLQAAQRVAASLSLLHHYRPQLWATRCHARKSASHRLLFRADEEARFGADERDLLVRVLGCQESGAALKIAIVDEGFSTGKTLMASRELYQKRLRDIAALDIRTAVTAADRLQLDTLYRNMPNPADYAVVPEVALAGKTGSLQKAYDNDAGRAAREAAGIAIRKRLQHQDNLTASSKGMPEDVLSHLFLPEPDLPCKPPPSP